MIRRLLICTATVVAGAWAVAAADTQGARPAGLIHVCVATDGRMHLLASGTAPCPPGQHHADWDAGGPPGLIGGDGPPGPDGESPRGPTGPRGIDATYGGIAFDQSHPQITGKSVFVYQATPDDTKLSGWSFTVHSSCLEGSYPIAAVPDYTGQVISRSPDPYTVYTVHMSMLAAAPTPYDPSVWDVTLFTPDPVRGNTLYDHTVGGHTFKDYEQHFLRTYFTLECYSTGSAPPPPPPAGSGNAAPSKPATAIDLRAVSESAEQVLADAVVGASGRLAIDLSGVPEATGRIVVSVPPQARLQGLGAQAATAARAARGAVIGKGTFADNQRGVGSALIRLTARGRALVRSLGQVIATLRISGRAPGVAPFTRQALIPLRRRGYRPRRQPRMSSGLIGR